MAKKTREDRLTSFEIVDCSAIPVVADLACDRLDFETTLFEKYIHNQTLAPFLETVKLINAFTRYAKDAPKGTPYIEFDYQSEPKAAKWRCRVTAYVDSATSARCLEFSEVSRDGNR